MEVLLGVLGVLVVCAFAAALLALPHFIEAVVHAHAPSVVGALALAPFGARDLPAEARPTLRVGDGYRGTKDVAAPGLEPGIWVIGPADAAHTRLTIVSERSALVTVMAEPRGPLARVPRALGTIRIDCVALGDRRRLLARVVPASLGLPLAIPGYRLALALLDGGGELGASMRVAVPVGLVVLLVWSAILWSLRSPRMRGSVAAAIDVLEKQLVASAGAAAARADS